MVKKDFMRRLKNTLLLKYNYNEVKDILCDYEEFFTIGLAEGKSQEELCKQFGNIKEIADNLSLELKQKTVLNRPLVAKVRLHLFITAALLIFGITYVMEILPNVYVIRASIIGVLFLTSAWWFMLVGGRASLPAISCQLSRKHDKLFIVFHIVLSVLTLACYLVLTHLENVWVRFTRAPFNMPIEKIGPLISYTLYFLILLVCVLLIYSLFYFYHYSRKFFTLTCHCIGCLVFLLCVYTLLHQLDAISTYKYRLSLCLLPYATSIILVLLFSTFISLLGKRRS